MKLSLLIAIAAFVPQTLFATRVVNYFAGKDETCLVMNKEGVVEGAKKKTEEVRGRLLQLISVTDYMTGGDTESYCTIAIELSGKTKRERRFSASSSKCSAISKLGAGGKEVILNVVKDHVCTFVDMPTD